MKRNQAPVPLVETTTAAREASEAHIAESVRLQHDERINTRAARVERYGLAYVEREESKARALAERYGVTS